MFVCVIVSMYSEYKTKNNNVHAHIPLLSSQNSKIKYW